MSKKLITVSPNLRVEEAAKLMAEKQVKRLPVLEEGGVVGIVTQTDIVASSFDLVTSLKEMVRARYRPPDFQP
jgi:predicted transcriptional regulator